MIKINYLHKGDSASYSDLKDSRGYSDNITESLIESINEPREFHLPLSGNRTGFIYCIVLLTSGTRYYVTPEEAQRLITEQSTNSIKPITD